MQEWRNTKEKKNEREKEEKRKGKRKSKRIIPARSICGTSPSKSRLV